MKWVTRIFTTLIFIAATPAFGDSAYSKMYVFGDSLSDPGNAFVVTGEISTRPDNASGIPDALMNAANWTHSCKLR